MSWDDAIADGDTGTHTWANNIISAIKAQGRTKHVSTGSYTDYQCDGTADDVQLVAAHTALGASGGTIMLGIGTYSIESAITPTNGNFQVVGQGRGNTVLKLGGNNHCYVLNALSNITFRDLEFDGNKAAFAGDVWSGIGGTTQDNLRVDNCSFHDFAGKGIFLSTCTDGNFTNNWFYSNTQDGFYLETSSFRNAVANCISYSNSRKGYNNGIVKDLQYTNCMAYSNEDGWNIEGSYTGAYTLRNMILNNCTSYGNSQYGYHLQADCHNVSLNNCYAYDNTIDGLYIRGEDTHIMKDIKVYGGSFYENTQCGIRIAYGVHNLTINNVALYNNDQGETNNDGLTVANVTQFQDWIIENIHAYDDQGAATQDRGLDFSTTSLAGKNIWCRNIIGSGNTVGLVRADVGIDCPTVQIPCFDATDAQATESNIGDHPSISCADGQDVPVHMSVFIPPDYHAVVALDILVVSLCTGGTVMRWNAACDWGAADEAYNNTSDATASTDTTLAANAIEAVDITDAISNIEANDKLGITFTREGSHANDTLGAVAHILGGYLKYV